MILLYTGAQIPDQAQSQSSQSLGGFISSSIVMNGTPNNIFSDLTSRDIQTNISFTRMLVLKNTTGSTKVNLTIFTELISSEFELKIGATAPATNSLTGKIFFEQLPNQNSLPYQATLTVRNEQTPINIPSLENNAVIGIWICLVKKDQTLNPSTYSIEDEIDQLKNSLAQIKKTDFYLKISYS